MTIAAGIGALILAIIHFLVDHIAFSRIPRSKWLSVAGGVSVAFIFVHVLPDLTEWQESFAEEATSNLTLFFEHHLYLVAMLGLAFFYGLERHARISNQSKRKAAQGNPPKNIQMFWIHIFSFTIYNFLIGYLLIHRENNTLNSLSFFVIAMAFHFLVNDFGLLEHYEKRYQKRGRWIIATSVILGWGVGAITEIEDAYIGIIYAFIAGGVIMNILKEELPEDRQSKFFYFLLGMLTYTALLLSI